MNNVIGYKGYYGDVHFSSADNVFHGKIIRINDLVTFEGASVRELKKAFREAVDDYLETCIEIGKELDKSHSA